MSGKLWFIDLSGEENPKMIFKHKQVSKNIVEAEGREPSIGAKARGPRNTNIHYKY